MLETVQVINSPMFKIKNSAGRIPRELGGVYTGKAEGDKAIRMFQSIIRTKPTIKRKKIKKAEPIAQEG